MKCVLIAFAALLFTLGMAGAQGHAPVFRKIQITDKFWSEGAACADFNHDGKMDIVSGPFWYEGPDFKARHQYYPAGQSFTTTNAQGQMLTIEGFEGALGVKNAYSEDFLTFTFDINGDGWPDIIIVGFPARNPSGTRIPKTRRASGRAILLLTQRMTNRPPLAIFWATANPL